MLTSLFSIYFYPASFTRKPLEKKDGFPKNERDTFFEISYFSDVAETASSTYYTRREVDEKNSS